MLPNCFRVGDIEYAINLTVGTLPLARAHGLDLAGAAAAQGLWALGDIDPEKLVAFLFDLLRPPVTPEEWAALFTAEVFEAALYSLVEAVADFFRTRAIGGLRGRVRELMANPTPTSTANGSAGSLPVKSA
jgi:hypothetical protein